MEHRSDEGSGRLHPAMFLKKRRDATRGVTLTEMSVVVLVLGISAGVMVTGSRIIHWVQRQLMVAQVQRDAQIQLYAITKDVRNAKKIVAVTPNTLVLGAFNTSLGYDSATSAIFNQLNIGTITYRYKTTTSSGAFLSRVEIFGGIEHEKPLLRNILTPPDAANYIFQTYPEANMADPNAVSIVVRIGTGYFKNAPRIYSAEATTRSTD